MIKTHNGRGNLFFKKFLLDLTLCATHKLTVMDCIKASNLDVLIQMSYDKLVINKRFTIILLCFVNLAVFAVLYSS